MSNYYSNPTANAAIGAVDRELKQMKKRAKNIGRLYRQGRLTPEDICRERRYFTGIYRGLLKKALRE